MKLTPKQQLFVDEYLFDLNATQAAIRAGYSTHTAKDIGCENLAKPSIKVEIDKALAERSRRTGITTDRVLVELAKIGFVNAADVMNFDDATVKEGSSRDDTAAIKSVKVKVTPTEDGSIVERELVLFDKLNALNQLGRHLGIDKLTIVNLPPPVFYGEDELE